MTHVQAFLKDEQGITTVEIILILVGGTDQSGHHLQKTAYQSGKQNLQQNHKSEQQYLIHSVSKKSNMKTFREHLKTQGCTEISPDEYQQNK